MSKKRDSVDMDDIQFDDFGDFGEGGYDGQEPSSKSRKPAVTLKGSFVSGVKQGVLDPSNQMAFARKALPKGYSQTLDLADKTTTELKGLYDYAAKEAEPAIKGLKKVTKTLLPGIEGKLPKGLAEKLKNWSDEVDRGSSTIDPEESEIAMSLGTIFNAHQQKMQAMQEAEGERQEVRDMVQAKQNRDQIAFLQDISNNLIRQTSYQDNVTAQYQQKSLELQYRSYFVQRKTLDAMEKHLGITETSMASIVHNTALPDILKEHNIEKAQELLKRKWLGEVTGNASQWFSSIGKKVIGKAKTDIKQFFADFGASVESAAGNIDMVKDQAQQSVEMGGGSEADFYKQFGGETAGGMAASWLMNLFGAKYVNGKLESRLGRSNNFLQMLMGRRQELFTNAQRDHAGKNRALDWLFDAAGSAPKPGTLVSKKIDQVDLDQRHYWTLQNSKTLNEIIPGWLSKIHFEIKHQRVHAQGGAEAAKGVEAEHFHWGSSQFETQSAFDKITAAEIDNKDIKKSYGGKLANLVLLLVPPDSGLSPKAKDRVITWLLEQLNKHVTDLDLVALIQPEEAGDLMVKTFGKYADEIREYFKEKLGYKEKTKWNFEGRPVSTVKGFGKNLRETLENAIAGGPFKNHKLVLQITLAYREAVESDKSYSIEKAIDISGRGFASADSLRRLGITSRKGDIDNPEEHLNEGRLFTDKHGNTVHIDQLKRSKEALSMGLVNQGYTAEELQAMGVRTGKNYDAQKGEYMEDFDKVTKSPEFQKWIKDKKTQPFLYYYGAYYQEPAGSGNFVLNMKKAYSAFQEWKAGGYDTKGVRYKRANGGYMPDNRLAFAGGGQVPGVGHATADDVDAKLSKGEYVVRKESTKVPGVLPLLRFINSLGAKPKHGPTGNVGAGEGYAFADGGTPGAKSNEMATFRTMVEEKFTFANESLGDLVTLLANIRSRPFISINAGQLGQFPDLHLTDLSSIEDLAIKGSRKIGKGASWIWDKVTKGVSGAASFGWDTTKSVGGFLKGAASAAGTTVKNWWEETSDIFVKGESEAKLRASVLKAGGYIDVKTGKVITSLKDITGEVKDLAGNIALEWSDYAKGLHDSHFRRALGWVKARGDDAFNIAKIPFKLLNSGKEFFHDVLDMPDDIYVEGDNPWHPRLYARKFRDEAYINAKGEVIKRVGQIDGPVFDKAYPDNPVLYEHELGKICDFNHEPVVGLGGRVRAKMKEAAKGLFKIPGHLVDMGIGAAAWLGDKVAGAFNWAKSGFQTGQFNIGFGVFSTGATTVTRLEQLWVLLNARLPGKKYKRPEDFGTTQAAMPRIMRMAGESKGWFGKWRASMDEKSKLGKEMAEAKKEAAKAYLEQKKNQLFDFIGNQNVKRNAKRQAAADFVGPMPQSAAKKAVDAASAKVQTLLGDKGSKKFWTDWYDQKLESLQTNHPELHQRLQKLERVDLRRVPKDMRAKYDDVMTRFKASGSITDLEEVVRLRESMVSLSTTAKTTAQMVGHNVASAAKAGGSQVKSKAISAGDQLKGTLKGVASALQAGSLQDKLMRVEGFAALQEYAKEHGSPAMKYMLLGDIDVTNGVSLRDALTAFDNMAKLTDAETEMLTKFMNKPEVKAIYKHHAKAAKLSAGKAKLQSAAATVQGAVTGAIDSAKGFFDKEKATSEASNDVTKATTDVKDPDQLIAMAEQQLATLEGSTGVAAEYHRIEWKRKLKQAKRLKSKQDRQALRDEERTYRENGRMVAQAIRNGMTLEEVNKIPGFFAKHSASVSASLASKKKAFLSVLGGKGLTATGKSRAEIQLEALDRAEAKRKKKADAIQAKADAKEAKRKAKESAALAKEAAKADDKAWRAKQGKLALGQGTPEELERYRRQKLGSVGRWLEDRKKNGGSGLFDSLGFRRGSKEDQEAAKEQKEKSGLFHDMANAFKKGWGRGAEGRAERKEGAKNKLTGALDWMKNFLSKDGLTSMVMGVKDLFSTFTGGLGKAFSLVKAISKINVGAKVMGALRTAGTVARGAAMMGMSGLGALASGAVSVAGTALGFIFSPVGLAVGAVAAIGYYGYKKYQNAKWDDWPISKFRLKQYGVDPTDKTKAAQIAQLEERVATITNAGKGQQATLSKGMDASELTAIFGVNPDDKEATNKWVIWFTRRFKPIWLTHATVFVNLTGKNVTDLNRADKMMNTETKLQYLKFVHFTGDSTPYDVMQSPYSGEETLTHWKMDNDKSWVNSAYDEAVAQVKENKEANDAEFAVSGDPKKLAAFRKEKEAKSVAGRMKAAWEAVKHPYDAVKNTDTAKFWQDKLSNSKTFQTIGDVATGKYGLSPEASKMLGSLKETGKNVGGFVSSLFKWSKDVPPGLGDAIDQAAAKYGLDAGYLRTMAYIESKGDPNAYPKGADPSKAAVGIYQFVPGTGKQYGLYPGGVDQRTNWSMNVDAGARYAQDNMRSLTALLGRRPEPWELYLAHQQGSGGFAKLVTAAAQGLDPSTIKVGKRTLRQNMDSNGGKGMTPQDFLGFWKGSFQQKYAALNATAIQPGATIKAKPTTAAPATVATAAKTGAATGTPTAAAPPAKTPAKPATAVASVKSTTDTVKQAATPPAPAKAAIAAGPVIPGVTDSATFTEDDMKRAFPETDKASANAQASLDKALKPDALMQTKLDVPIPAAQTPPEESKIPTDIMMVNDATEKAKAQAAADQRRDEAINNTAGGIDGVVQLMRENVKLSVSMDRSLTEINDTLKKMVMKSARESRDDDKDQPNRSAPQRQLLAGAQPQTNRPISMGKGAV